MTPRRGDPPASRASGRRGKPAPRRLGLGVQPSGRRKRLPVDSKPLVRGALSGGSVVAAAVRPHVCPAATCSSDRPVARVRTALHTVCLPLTRPTSRAVQEPLRVVTKSVCEPLPGHGSHFSGSGGDLGEAMGNARTRGYRPGSGATPPAPPAAGRDHLPVCPRRVSPSPPAGVTSGSFHLNFLRC